MSDAEDLAEQINKLRDKFESKKTKIDTSMKRTMLTCALLVERYAKEHMTPDGPSAPGEFPAVDTGRLRASITHRIEEEDGTSVGYVGTSVEYATALEFGTSRMAPRPFLLPSLEANRAEIVDRIKKAVEREEATE